MGNDSLSGRIAESKATQGEAKRHAKLVNFLIRLVKEKPLGMVGLVITLLLLIVGIFADFIAPYGYNETFPAEALSSPSVRFWLGTDNLGRDVLSRVIYGARVSLIVGLAATTLCTFISVVIGLVSGYIGGKFDLVVQRFVDGFMCLPWIFMLMLIMSITGQGMLPLIIAIGVLSGISRSRFPRSVVISIKGNVYVEAAVAIGCSTPRTLIRHILPNIMSPIITSFSLTLPGVILTEASLSFLGLGVPPPAPSWGGMLSGTGRSYMFLAPWMILWPGVALSVVVYGINMFGDAVRDILDPRLRGGAGRYGVRVKKKPPKK